MRKTFLVISSVRAVNGLLIIFSTCWLFLRARRLDRAGSAERVKKVREPALPTSA